MVSPYGRQPGQPNQPFIRPGMTPPPGSLPPRPIAGLSQQHPGQFRPPPGSPQRPGSAQPRPQFNQVGPQQSFAPAATPTPPPAQNATDVQASRTASKRAYQVGYDNAGGYGSSQPTGYMPGPQPPVPGQPQVPSPQQPSQFFTPASGDVAAAPQPYPQPYGAQGQAPPQPQYGVQQMTKQFGQMGVQQPPLQLLNVPLIGTQPNVQALDEPPPTINLPPTVAVNPEKFVIADPSYQRCTFNAIPATESLLKKSRLPFGIVITPYRSIKDGEPEVPVVSDAVIARCRRCRTYINPFVTFTEGDHRWKCNMCNLTNEVPQAFDWDQQNNRPANRWDRAELNHSVVEYIAPTEYAFRPPQPPVYVFLIDVSYPAVQSGMVATAARTILESLDRLPNDDSRTKVAFIAVDNNLHFFSLPPGSTDPTMLVVGDLDDVFLPQPNDLLVNLTESRAGIESLLGRLNDMFKDNASPSHALGPALQTAYRMISAIGGKIMCLVSTLPNVGTGALKNREDVKLLGTPKESTLLQAASAFYKSFAVDCSRTTVSVDMWLFGSSYTDVATLSCLPRFTGGQTYFYPAFNASRSEDAMKFAHEFGEILASPICLEAVIRVRATKGLRLSAFHGNFFVRSTDLMALSAVPMDQSYCIELAYDENPTGNMACIQTGILHSTSFGERRIRVITTAYPLTHSISEVYASADQIALTTLLANKAVERSLSSKLEDARDAVLNKMVDILGVYKAHMTSSGSGATGQLQISDNLKMMPLLILGLMKHVGLRQSSQIPSDLRAYAQALLTTLPSQQLIPYLHPRFYSLHDMPSEAGLPGDKGIVMPPPMNLSSERLMRNGLYLIEDSQTIFLWLGREAHPALINDVFGVNGYDQVRPGKTTLPSLDNGFSKRVGAVIGKTREMRRGPYWPHLYVVKEDGEPSLRMWALSCLIEDRSDSVMSYYQFLNQLKEKVNGTSF